MKELKWLTLTNIMAFFMVLLYILDRWIVPLPESYQGFSWGKLSDEAIQEQFGEEYNNLSEEERNTIEIIKLIKGESGGAITNELALVDTNINPNGNAWYRYFTVVFTHAFHLHMITNVIAFIIIGNFIEKKFGAVPMLVLFFLTDILGVPLTNLITHETSAVIAGASGGIFGLFGIGLAMCLQNKNIFKEFSNGKKIYLAAYGFIPTYILSFGWTTVVHNISLIIGIAIAYILYLLVPKYKEIVNNANNT